MLAYSLARVIYRGCGYGYDHDHDRDCRVDGCD